jgi:hypothetical protein
MPQVASTVIKSYHHRLFANVRIQYFEVFVDAKRTAIVLIFCTRCIRALSVPLIYKAKRDFYFIFSKSSAVQLTAVSVCFNAVLEKLEIIKWVMLTKQS